MRLPQIRMRLHVHVNVRSTSLQFLGGNIAALYQCVTVICDVLVIGSVVFETKGNMKVKL
jgi:hypothetical protein